MALLGLTVSVLSPLRAALIDRHGPRRVLPPMAAAYALTLAGLAALTWRPGAPFALLLALTAAAYVTAPPLGVVMRTLWNVLVPDGPLLRRAYSLDTVCEELVFVTGPLLAGLLAAVASPSLGIALSAVLVAAYTVGLVTSPAVRPRPSGRRRGAACARSRSSRPSPPRPPASCWARRACWPSRSPSTTATRRGRLGGGRARGRQHLRRPRLRGAEPLPARTRPLALLLCPAPPRPPRASHRPSSC